MQASTGRKRRAVMRIAAGAVATLIITVMGYVLFAAPAPAWSTKKDKPEQTTDTHKNQRGRGHSQHGNGRGNGHHKDHGHEATPTTVKHEPPSCDHENDCKPECEDCTTPTSKPHRHDKDCGHQTTTTSTVPATTTTVAPTTTTTVFQDTTTTSTPESTTSTTFTGSSATTYNTTSTTVVTPVGVFPDETPEEFVATSSTKELAHTGAPVFWILFGVLFLIIAGGGAILAVRFAPDRRGQML